MNSILTPGKRLKKIRKALGLKQFEITGGLITRNLISIIENEKASLTDNVADILCVNINSICIKKGIDFSITPE